MKKLVRKIDYEFIRDSVAAAVNSPSPAITVSNQVVFERGVRGSVGASIAPAATQLFYDNYFSNQTVDVAIASPWSKVGTGAATARDENVLLDSLSIELEPDTRMYQTYDMGGNAHTVSAFVYIPPPTRIDAITIRFKGSHNPPTGIVSLGDYWYFIWYTGTVAAGAGGQGIGNASTSEGSIWVDCMSLTQTDAPLPFIPNSATAATATSEDTNLKYKLDQPLSESGTISFTFIPFYDIGDSIDTYPRLLCFVPDGGDTDGDDYLEVLHGSTGLYLRKKKGGGTNEFTYTDGYAAASFEAFVPHDIIITWDFTSHGTKLINIWTDGNLEVTSDNFTEGFPTNLKDIWIGVENESGGLTNHFQGIIQDVEIYRRAS